MPTFDEFLSELIRRLSDQTPDTSITLSGGLTVRATRRAAGYRITAERRQVKPSLYEMHALKASLGRLGYAVRQEGSSESGALYREWLNVEKHSSNGSTTATE